MNIGILLTIIATFFGAFGQYFFKLGAKSTGGSIIATMLHHYTILGILLYGIATVIYVYALKFEELSTLAPIIALSYLWTVILGALLLHETVTAVKWLGLFFILLGVFLVSR